MVTADSWTEEVFRPVRGVVEMEIWVVMVQRTTGLHVPYFFFFPILFFFSFVLGAGFDTTTFSYPFSSFSSFLSFLYEFYCHCALECVPWPRGQLAQHD